LLLIEREERTEEYENWVLTEYFDLSDRRLEKKNYVKRGFMTCNVSRYHKRYKIQDTQRTYHVRVKRVRASIIAVERQSLLDILSARVRGCVCVALDIQHSMLMRHFVICGLPGSTTVFHII
jgi:hypothetical protein